MIQYARQHHLALTEKLQAARHVMALHQNGGAPLLSAHAASAAAAAATTASLASSSSAATPHQQPSAPSSAKTVKKSAGRDRGNSVAVSAATQARLAAEEFDAAKASEDALLLELDAQATLLSNLTRHVLPLHTMRLHDTSDHLQKIETVLIASAEAAERAAQDAVKEAERQEADEKAKMASLEEYAGISEEQRNAAVSRYRKAFKIVLFLSLSQSLNTQQRLNGI